MESVTFASLESQKNEITQLMMTSISAENVWYVAADLSMYEKVILLRTGIAVVFCY